MPLGSTRHTEWLTQVVLTSLFIDESWPFPRGPKSLSDKETYTLLPFETRGKILLGAQMQFLFEQERKICLGGHNGVKIRQSTLKFFLELLQERR